MEFKVEMVTKNILFSSEIKFLFIFVAAVALSGCGHQKSRPESPSTHSVGVDVPVNGSEQLPPPPPPKGEVPKIGLILGPGGLKAFAHLGVLREFEKHKIPIHSIVGLEWGALVGGLYSIKGKANDLEWQLSKLKKSDLPGHGIWGSTVEAASIKELNTFFDATFGNRKLEEASIPFSCPSSFTSNGKIVWWGQGNFKQTMQKCVAFPPLYHSSQGWVAASFEVEEAAKHLRDQGANLIVFVNVVARGSIIKEDRLKDPESVSIIWWEGLSKMNASSNFVNWLVGVHTRNYDILDFDARQSFVEFGREFGEAAAKKISEEYGF